MSVSHRLSRRIFSGPFVVGLALLMAWALGLGFRLARNTPSGYFEPKGYYEVVNDLIDDKFIVLSSETDDNGFRFVDYSKDKEEEFPSFLIRWKADSNSLLNQDLGKYKAKPAEYPFFIVRGGELKSVNPSIRKAPIGDLSRKGWIGELTSRRQRPRPLLVGTVSRGGDAADRQQIQISFTETNRRLRAGDFIKADLAAIPSGVVSGLAVQYRRQDAFLFFPVGDSLILEVVRHSGSEVFRNVSCRVNGYALDDGTLLALLDGDLVSLSDGSSRVSLVYRAEGTASLLSSCRELNGQFDRVWYDESLAWARDLAQSIDWAVRNSPVFVDPQDFSVDLSLDRGLQAAVQGALDGAAAALYLNSDVPGLRASATLMDADTGQLLVLASWPRVVIREDDETVVPRNHNFVNHPIGSTIKALSAAAALDTHPEVASFAIRNYARETCDHVFNLDLRPKGYLARGLESADGWVDFSDFIRYSSNRYSVELGFLSLARWEPGSRVPVLSGLELEYPNWFRLGSETYRYGPDLGTITADGQSVRLLHRTEFFSALSSLANISAFYGSRRGPGEDTLSAFKYEIIGPILDHLGLRPQAETDGDESAEDREDSIARTVAAMLRGSFVPDRVNLGVNRWHYVRGDLVSFFLGGAENRWNNVQIAESLARVVTNQPVSATLVRAVRSADGTLLREADSGPGAELLSHRTWKTLLSALEGPTLPDGTAGQLKPLLDDWNRRLGSTGQVQVFSKTGTLIGTPLKDREGNIVARAEHVGMYSAVIRLARSGKPPMHLALVVFFEPQHGEGADAAVSFAKEILPTVEAWVMEAGRNEAP